MNRAAALAIFVLVSGSASAWDFGVNVENVTNGMVGGSTALTQQDTVGPWVSLTSQNSRFRAEGLVQYLGTFQSGASTQVPYRVDVKELSWETQWPDLVASGTATLVKVGRFDFSDTTGRVLDGTFDGVNFQQTVAPAHLSFQAGYTGLVAQRDVNVDVSAADTLEFQGDEAPYFAPRRVFFSIQSAFNDILDRHDLVFEALGQVDLRGGNDVHTGYLTARFGGRPASWLKWSLYTTGELWSDLPSVASAAAGTKVVFSAPSWGLVAVADLEWASGRAGGLRAFSGINSQTLGSVSPEVFSNILVTKTNLALRVGPGLVAGADNSVLFRSGDGRPADLDFPKDATASYLGDEVLATLDYGFAGELQVNAKAGVFVPNTANNAYGSTASLRWLGAITVKWSL